MKIGHFIKKGGSALAARHSIIVQSLIWVFIEHIKLYDHAEAWPKKKSNLPSIAKKNFLKGVFSPFKGLNERFKRLFLKGKNLKGKIQNLKGQIQKVHIKILMSKNDL